MEADTRNGIYSLAYDIVELTWQVQLEVNVLTIYRAEGLTLPEETYLKFKEHRARLKRLLDRIERQADTEYQQHEGT